MSGAAGHVRNRRRTLTGTFEQVTLFIHRPVRRGDRGRARSLRSGERYAVWAKALERRGTDPEGAITAARTLLEAVLKRILDARGVRYGSGDDLPALYRTVAVALDLAPEQQAADAVKSVLGGVAGIVSGLGTLRNKLSDAHGRGGVAPVAAEARHAALAVNVAGAVAAFLVETHRSSAEAGPRS